MRSLMVFISVIVLVCVPAVAGSGIRVVQKPPATAGWLEIKGYGKDRQSANRDAIRQIQQVFGRHHIVSEAVVVNDVLEKDEIRMDTVFSVSRLDRFYDGTYRRDGRFIASFSFPKGVLVDLRADNRVVEEVPEIAEKKPRVAKRKVSKKPWRVPESVIRFIDFFVWDVR